VTLRRISTVAGAASAILLASTTSAQQQQLVLRSSTNSVAVHVLVRTSSGPVRDLTAADFVITDSGVRQDIATMTIEPLPLDVTVVVDRLAQSEFASVKRHPQIEDIEETLTQDDRIRVVGVGADIDERSPFSPPGRAAAMAPARPSDQPALFDGVASALLRVTPPGRQHVVIVITEGYDAFSFTSAAALTDIAQRTDARMYVVVAQGRSVKARTLARAPSPLPLDDGLGSLVEIARDTGGNVVSVSRLTRAITGPIRRVFSDVRAGYVLYYTPTGVSDRGWHPISVTISRPGQFEIQARPGYAN
jgi:VWFA-related protein